MSHNVFARDCETMPELTAWAVGHIPAASLHLLDGEVIIHTGMTVEMNGELMPLSDEEEEMNEIRDDSPSICNLCGENLGDVFLARVVHPWGDTCGDCMESVNPLRTINPIRL